uniref:Uncharacterized protein n=1 Tax=viral metagenome TaxID=1070528 RepID=A0A6C0JV91_9ZZZZ
MITPHKKYTCSCKNLNGTTKKAITEAMIFSTLVRNSTALHAGKTVQVNLYSKLNVYDRWHGAPNGSGRSIQNKF